jgi:hypothetical protein
MNEERKGTRGASKRAARAQRVPEGNSRDSSNGLNREHHTSRQETPQDLGRNSIVLSETATNGDSGAKNEIVSIRRGSLACQKY